MFFALLFFAIGQKEFSTSFPIIATVGIFSSTFMIIPTLIIELRKSLILKRIGAAKITKHEFLLILFFYFFIVILVAIIWAFILYTIFGAIKSGVRDSWKYHKNIGNVIYAALILGVLSIIFSIFIGLNIKNSMIASAISFCIIFFSLFTSGLLMPITQVRQINGLVIVGFIIPFDWPIIMMQEAWGVGSLVFNPEIGKSVYYLANDNIWNFYSSFKVFVLTKDLQPITKEVEIVSSLAKGWNIFAPWITLAIVGPIIPFTFKWTER